MVPQCPEQRRIAISIDALRGPVDCEGNHLPDTPYFRQALADATRFAPARRHDLSICPVGYSATPDDLRYLDTLRKRNALPITETEDRLMASAAMSGLNNQPVTGYNTPAAKGIPNAL